MFELNVFRCLLVTGCFGLLAACGGAPVTPSSSTVASTGQAPPSPTQLNAQAGNAQATLTWSASAGATGYHVKRATTSGGPYAQVSAPTSNTYVDASLTNGTTYFYVVSAVDSAGESADSAQVSVVPTAGNTIPAAPTGLKATAGNAQASLTWSPSSGATSYHVKRATTSGGPYTQVGAPTSAAYTDSSLTNGTTYYYVVSAVDSAGESADSAAVSVLPAAQTSIPAVPTALSAASSNAQVSLIWAASSGATGYHVKRATTSGGPYTQVGAPAPASYTDTSVTNGTTYFYVVSALNAAGESANSTEVSATPASTASNPPPATTGTWVNVTPAGASGAQTMAVAADPQNPSNLYAQFGGSGIWKSTDYGQTWTAISTGANSSTVNGCGAQIALAPGPTAGSVPTLFESCIGGGAIGFWVSTDGGVNWTKYTVAPLPAGRQDVYAPVVDPYDPKHLLMCGHEQNYVVESTDGGHTWTNVTLAGGMNVPGGTGAAFFINTGNPTTTRTTWLWIAQQTGGLYGTWRTADGGATWTQVDKNEHPHAVTQIYQPGTNGVVYMGGAYSTLGWGVLRSADYGQTWTHEGVSGNISAVYGTSENVYADLGDDGFYPELEVAAQPGTGTWAQPTPPATWVSGNTGPAVVAVVNDGTHNVLVAATWSLGLWRYVEP